MTETPYLVVIRALSAAQLDFDDPLIARIPAGECVIKSEHVGGAEGWPVSLRGEVRGNAESLDDAQERLSEAGGGLLALVSLAANAAYADPGLVVAHGVEPRDGSPAEWIGYEWPSPSDLFPPRTRTVSSALVGALLEGGDRYPSGGYHGRAAGLYCEALRYWRPESTLLAAEYLWMATEALSRGVVEADAAKLGITPSNLATMRKTTVPSLYRLAREEIFAGDLDVLNALGKASEGFEHGFMPIPDIRALAEPILDRAAHRVRHGLISVLDLANATRAALLAPEFDEPRGLVPALKILRGELLVTDAHEAPEAIQDAVEVDWEPGAEREITRGPDGVLTITGETTATLKSDLPAGVDLDVTASGVRVAGVSGYTVDDVVVRRANDTTHD